MRNIIMAIVIAIGAIGTAGTASASVETATSSVHCWTGTFGETRCDMTDDYGLGTRKQVIIGDAPTGHFQHGARLHIEWESSDAVCVVFEDMSGHCYLTYGFPVFNVYNIDADGRSTYLGGDGRRHSDNDVPNYFGHVAIGRTEHVATQVFMPNAADPNLQFPLIMFWPEAW